MIDINMMSVIDNWPYKCTAIKGNVAVLEKIGKGTLITVDRDTCPYIDTSTKVLITPEKKLVIKPKSKLPKKYKAKTIDIMKIIKNEVDISISRDLVYFVRDHVETLIANLAIEASNNATRNGEKRLAPRHWYWLEVPIHGTQTIVREHDDLAKDIKMNDWK